jgi:hypothetical protein
MLRERDRVLVLWVQITTHSNIRAQICGCGWVSKVRGNGPIDHVHGVQGQPIQGGHKGFSHLIQMGLCQGEPLPTQVVLISLDSC